MQGVGVGFFSKRFNDSVLLKYSVVVMSVSYLSLVSALVTTCMHPVLNFSMPCLYVVYGSQSSSAVCGDGAYDYGGGVAQHDS